MHQKCSNYALTNLLFGLCKSLWIIDSLVIRSSPHPRGPTCLSYPPKCCELKSIPELLLLFSLLNVHLNISKSLGVRHLAWPQSQQHYVLERLAQGLACSPSSLVWLVPWLSERQHPHLGDSFEREYWTFFHGDPCKLCINIGWGWEVKNGFQVKGKVEGENDRTSFLQCLCWGSFEPNSTYNKWCEERKNGYYLTYSSHLSS